MPLYISKETLAQIELVLLLCVLYILHRKKKYNTNEADWDHLLADEGQEKQEMVGAPQEMWCHATGSLICRANPHRVTHLAVGLLLYGLHARRVASVYEDKEKGEPNIIIRGCSRGWVELVGIWMCSWLILHWCCVNRCSELCLRVKGQLLAPR